MDFQILVKFFSTGLFWRSPNLLPGTRIFVANFDAIPSSSCILLMLFQITPNPEFQHQRPSSISKNVTTRPFPQNVENYMVSSGRPQSKCILYESWEQTKK
ncbi:hypothetical protein CRM22_006397 [Opisthorchis felineus]|uniref:Uncharacterized protein n=1 Tax=Opisthorchis felineus TaxID=147828 RepID=A0A4S2LMT4_OPIFE|nr:hypothetical protein CRM22_006397 [Opisthorchis felineus]